MQAARVCQASRMPKPTPPRKRGHAGRAARARFVEVENSLPRPGPATEPRMIIETADGLRLLLADSTAVAMLADHFELARPLRKGGRP